MKQFTRIFASLLLVMFVLPLFVSAVTPQDGFIDPAEVEREAQIDALLDERQCLLLQDSPDHAKITAIDPSFPLQCE